MSALDEEAGRQRRGFASLAARAVPGPGCPEPERLWEAASGRLGAEETWTLVEHTASCPSCAEDWRLAGELRRQAGEAFGPASGARARSYVRWGLAAAAVVIALVTIPRWRDGTVVRTPETVREVAGPAGIRSLVPEDAVLDRADCVLRWAAGSEPVVGYDLVVATEELDVLVKVTGLEEPTFRLPEESLSQVPPGGRILWRVEVTFAMGGRADSPTFVHRLR